MRQLIVFLAVVWSAPVWASLDVTAVSSPTLQVPYYYTGNGAGFAMGAFDIENSGSAGAVLESVTLTATDGVGNYSDDSTAFSEIGLFVDSNSNGTFDPGVDVRYGPVFTAYPTDNGTLVLPEALSFPAGGSTRFLIVAKLNGSVLPYHNHNFHTTVTAITCASAAVTGVPSALIPGVSVLGGPTPLTLEYSISGSSPYTYNFRLVNDNHNGTWAAGQEWNFVDFGYSVFGAGGAPFTGWVTDSGSYPIGPWTTTGWAISSIGGVVYSGPALGASADWMPASVGDQLIWWGTVNAFLDEGEMTHHSIMNGGPTQQGSAVLEPAYRVGDYLRVTPVLGSGVDVAPTGIGGGNGFAIGAFDVISHSNAATLSDITLAASGTGDDSSAFSDIRLFVDSNGNGAYDPGVDAQFGAAYTAYPSDDGQLTFSGTLNFNPNETKRLLVVAQLNGATLATYGQTFDSTVAAISATGFMHSGLPTAVMPGIHISAPTLTLATSAAVQNEAADAQGPGGLGLAACEFLLTNNTVGVANLDSITVASAGSLFDQTDASYVALFRDANGNGSFDAADVQYGGTATAFPGDDGSLTFSQAITFAAGQSRLFFLVVKLSGTAAIGADFWCRVPALGVSGGTETIGVPGELVHALTVTSSGLPIDPPGGDDNGGNDGGCSTGDRAALGWLAWLGVLTLLAWRCRGARRAQ